MGKWEEAKLKALAWGGTRGNLRASGYHGGGARPQTHRAPCQGIGSVRSVGQINLVRHTRLSATDSDCSDCPRGSRGEVSLSALSASPRSFPELEVDMSHETACSSCDAVQCLESSGDRQAQGNPFFFDTPTSRADVKCETVSIGDGALFVMSRV